MITAGGRTSLAQGILRRLPPLQATQCIDTYSKAMETLATKVCLHEDPPRALMLTQDSETSHRTFLLPLGQTKTSFLPPPARGHRNKGNQVTNTRAHLKPAVNIFTFDELEFKDLEIDNKSVREFINITETDNLKTKDSSVVSISQPKLSQFQWPTSFHSSLSCSFCSSLDSMSTDSRAENKEKKEPNLEKVAHQLTYDLMHIFHKNQNWWMYHQNMVLEDNVRGRRYVGLDKYIKIVNLLKLTAHIRFVYVRFQILKISKHPDNGTIRVRWRIVGMGMVRMILRYFPDKMWIKGGMERAAPSWYDGLSTFYVGEDDLIYKHTVDIAIKDEEQELVETLAEKIKKLKPVREPLSPAL